MSPEMNEKELLSRISELPREVGPARDPWPEIAERIEGPAMEAGRKRFGRWPQALAAAMVLAVSAGLVFGPMRSSAPVPTEQPTVITQQSVPAADPGFPGVLAASEAEYRAAIREFIPVGQSREQLPALAVEKIEMGWSDLLNTENALVTALQNNPNDPFLNRRMLELRSRQIGFLKQLAMLDLSNRRLTI